MHNKSVALVTGANQGIGLQIAKDLVGHGFTVLMGSRNFERGEAAAKEVGADALALQLDVTDQASIAAAAQRVRGEFGPPPLTSDDSVLLSHPRIGYVVAYGTAALIATVRGNAAWTQQYEQKALEGMDEIMEQLVRAEQGQVRRAARQTRRR